MSISIWDLFKYLYKWKVAIIIVTVLSFFAADLYVNKKQTYSSNAIIQYNDSCISNGKTLNGELFDSNEIKAPAVILNVIKDMGYNRRIESMRENISITPVIPKTVENLKAANEKLGEEYQFYPKTFVITYKGNSSYEATRDVLSSIIKNYFNYYSETYLYLATLNEVDYNINKKNFDYIEQAELISNNVKQTIESLSTYARDSAGYRSPNTGLTFADIKQEFELIKEFTMPKIFSKILIGQVSMDEKLLISKYTERLEDNEREMENLSYRAGLALDRMESYVRATEKEAGVAQTELEPQDSSVSVINGIEHDKDNTVEEQMTYDGLINSYASDSVLANEKKIDMEYCRNIIERFKRAENSKIDYDEYENEVKTMIAETLDKLQELYTEANINISDYNEFIPALHIRKLSGVSYYGNVNGLVYKFIAIIAGFSLSCLAAIAYEIMKKYSAYSAAEEKSGEESDEESGNEEE